MTGNYSWQDRAFPEWKARGYTGLIMASTGAGKSRAGRIVIQKYHEEFPEHRIVVVSPSTKVNLSWIEELEGNGVDYVEVYTYQTAVNRMLRNGLQCEMLVCDECHRLCTPVQGRVLEMKPKHVLGLSATPQGAVRILGEPFIDIGVDKANLCDFKLHFVSIPLSKSERAQYDSITERMKSRALKVSNGTQSYLAPKRDSYGWDSYDSLARKRRDICYKFESRIPYTVALVKKHAGSKTVVYCERRETMGRIATALLKEGIRATDDSGVTEFENGDYDVLVLCGKLREGWNCVGITTIIMASINTQVIRNVQTIGRSLRLDPDNPDKVATIYMMLASDTSDMRVIENIRTYYRGHYDVLPIQAVLNER